MKKIIIGIVCAVIIIALYFLIQNRSLDSKNKRSSTPLVKIEKPMIEKIKIQHQFNGDVLAIHQATISSKVSGNLENIYADMGNRVLNGQLLATIDSTELYQQYQQMQATYQNAKSTYDRIKQLIEKDLASKQDLDNAEATFKIAQANYEVASTKLSYTKIIAPFSGIITKRFLDVGALVNANNSTLFILMNIDKVKIIVNIPEVDVPSIYNVKTAKVTLDALKDKSFIGNLTLVSNALDLNTRTMAVQVEVDNPTHIIKPGMFATIVLTVAEKQNAITIPTNAILKDTKGKYIFIVDENNIANQVRITTGEEMVERTEITSGLNGKENVIVVGQQYVKNNQSVIVK